ncbi:MAG: hypothetical protein A2261_03825 [Candidatus Magasanikbacteria bacterium RIFOXYA2_FULL_44_8]|uniref:Transcription elongation factor GreA n=1 Tax=Candidatus Magasanikbacteria bacterium RIFOXYA2_FULL_44_8 TaxID=1798696 RepID=A0A1F6NIX7_9BACT|nr:MAG: hypothetical protein A2261_03825 [Candidatus Magasanikbacteria bacterium RIFOXYA2_FULL_44_8]
MDENTQYLSADSLSALNKEYELLKSKTIPDIAKRIDEAKQQGDLSENAEYHQAREDMSWAQGRVLEVEQILNNAKIIKKGTTVGKVSLGCTVTVKIGGTTKSYTIVGQQEASPSKGLISNESPLGNAFIGHEIGDKVEVITPAGKQTYEIIAVE